MDLGTALTKYMSYSVIKTLSAKIENTAVFFSGVSFTKLEKRLCSTDSYGSYDTLVKAQDACRADEKCFSVYDVLCNNSPPLYLCPESDTLSYSYSSCLYQKQGRLPFGRHC